MRKQNSTFKTAFTSEADKNLKNTDSFGYVELDKYACYVVADGIDDQVDGTAAKLAVDTIISAFTEAPSMRKGAIRRYLRAANRALLAADSKMRLKASVIVVVSDYVKLRYGQAGNARLRLYRDGFLRLQSKDQSLSMDLVKAEKLEPDKLAKHQERHNLYCYLGQDKEFRPYISKKFKLSDSDAAALMTRGLWEYVDDGILKDAFADASDEPQETVDAVEDLLLSAQPEDLGSYTFATIFFNKVYTDPNRKRKIKRAVMIAIPILLVLVVVAIVLIVLYNNRQKQIASMEQNYYDTIEYIQEDNYIRAQEKCQEALSLAEDLGDEEIRSDADNYLKLIESVIAGDDALTNGEYSDAQRYFLNAQNRSRYADNLGQDYISDRLAQTSQYMSVYEMISLGDTLAQGMQYEAAEEQYLAARALAAQIYFDTGRDDAIAALEQLYADQAEQEAQDAEAAQETATAQAAAASVAAEGDAAFAQGEYERARTFYTTALQQYTELEDQAQIDALTTKLASIAALQADQAALADEAQSYVSQAEAQYSAGNFVQAKKYYLLARDVYAQLGDDAKLSEVTRRLEVIEMGISEQEAAEREAAEREAAEREEAEQAAETATPAPESTAPTPEASGSPAPEAVG
mgnify:FL=1